MLWNFWPARFGRCFAHVGSTSKTIEFHAMWTKTMSWNLAKENWYILVNCFWLVVWNIFYCPFHIWGCHPSHWLSYVSRWLKPPTRSLLLLFLRSHYHTMCFPISYEFSTGVSKNSVYGHRRHILLRPDHTRTFNTNNNWLVVWNMLYFSIQLGMPSSQLTFIFFRGVETTNQIRMMIITIKT